MDISRIILNLSGITYSQYQLGYTKLKDSTLAGFANFMGNSFFGDSRDEDYSMLFLISGENDTRLFINGEKIPGDDFRLKMSCGKLMITSFFEVGEKTYTGPEVYNDIESIDRNSIEIIVSSPGQGMIDSYTREKKLFQKPVIHCDSQGFFRLCLSGDIYLLRKIDPKNNEPKTMARIIEFPGNYTKWH